jgi:aminopeptidase N
MKLYFERFDGQAVTCDDFAQAIADANPGSSSGALLPQFKRWYSQAGTPICTPTGTYDAAGQTLHPGIQTKLPATAGPVQQRTLCDPVLTLDLLGAVAQHCH